MAAQTDELRKLIKELKVLETKAKEASTVGAQKELWDKLNENLKIANEYYKDNKAQINDTDGELRKSLKTIEKTNKGLQSMLLLNKGITTTFSDMSTQSIKFAKSTDEWFKKGEKLAEQYLRVSRNIGLSEARSKTMTTNFNGAVKETLLLGYNLDDLRDTFETFAEETGRARILSSEEAENIAKVSKGANLYATEATKMAEQFDLMGISSEKMVNLLNESIRTSRELGLNSNKVIKTLQSNMKAMQQYSFVSGVKGMVEMAKQAVKMRVDISEVLQMADKFYHPEAAIEAAANLQLLGGDIAEAFGDPLAIMYEARNKPEELAKRIAKMTENMVSFNEKTGEFEFPASARMQLQVVSKELGLSMESLTEMTRQASKIKSIKMNVSGNILDEDMREGIAGMARMKDGKWQVDFEEGGKHFTKSIDSLTSEQAKLVLDQEKEFADKTEKDYLKDIALYTQSFSEKVENIGESQQYGFAAEMDVYSVTMDAFLKDSLDTYRIESQNMMTALSTSFGDGGGFREVLKDAFVGPGSEALIEEGFRKMFSNMTTAIHNSMTKADGTLDIADLRSNSVNVLTDGIPEVHDVKLDSNNDTYIFGPKGTFKLNKDDEYHGKDGKFTAGTNLGMDKNISTTNNNKSVVENKLSGNAEVTIRVISDNKNIKIDKDYISGVVGKILNSGLAARDGARLPEPGGANVNQDMLV